jgi:ubiquinone/menaquinone biosynthesis C-methylase UbiE
MKANYTQPPQNTIQGKNRDIAVFSIDGDNIDHNVVASFGDEWAKFHDFSDEAIDQAGHEYFDILNETIINKNTYGIDIGCGTGRWSKYLASKIGFMELIDPSNAILVADKLLGKIDNVRLTKTGVEQIPFADETFDFAMSVGVLHHIPNTQQAMKDCVQKVKRGGYFYCYLYHNLETRGPLFKGLFWLSNLLRYVVCRMPAKPKQLVCDILAVVVYMPFVLWVRLLTIIGCKKLASKMPLSAYADKPFFIIRNDALDKFGTSLEQRFSKEQVTTMMRNCGLDEIVISPSSPFYHAVGRKR